MHPELPDLRGIAGAALGRSWNLDLRPSRDIAASRINLGIECVDRGMWDVAAALPELGETGAKWARVQTGWSSCETTDGVFDFAWLDDLVDRVIAAGVRPWFNVTYGNPLHSGAPTKDAVGWAPVYAPTARAAWLRFIAALVRHFRDRVTHYEIWNEPDITVFWKHELPHPHRYAELVAITAAEIRRHQTDAFIIGGSIAFGGNPRGFQYLEQALRAGMGRHLDAVSYHTYRPRPEANRPEEMMALRAMLARHGLTVQIWQGEAGCPSDQAAISALSGLPWTEAKQAKFVLRRMITDLGHGVDLTSHFHLADFPNYLMDGPADRVTYFGLLRLNGAARKPAFAAFQSLSNLFDEQTVLDRELHVLVDVEEAAPAGHARKDWLLTQVIPFARRGLPMVAFWYPSELNPDTANGAQPFAPGRVTVSVSHPLGHRLSNPVLIDPITQRVYALTAERRGFRYALDVGTQFVFAGLPLTDHPLILTDLAALDVRESDLSPWFRRWRVARPQPGDQIAALPCPVEPPGARDHRCGADGFVCLRPDWILQKGHATAFSSCAVPEAMQVEVQVSGDAPLRLWIDGAEAKAGATVRLAAGAHAVAALIDIKNGAATGFGVRLRRTDAGGPDPLVPQPWI